MGTSNAAASRKRILGSLFLGACLGAVGAALVWQFYPGFWKEPPVGAHEVALQRRQELREDAQQQAARAARAAMQPVSVPTPCDREPLIPPGGARDGQASVEHPFPGGPRARAKVFLRQAQAAVAQGRPRDAEVALLAACRENDAASAKPTVPRARVLGMLGERYAVAAGAENAAMLREQLMARARDVLRLSAQAYAAALGPNASRSRQARQQLAALEQELVGAADGPRPGARRLHDEADPAQAASARPEPAARARGAPPAKAVAVRGGTSRPQPVRQPTVPDPGPQSADTGPPQDRFSPASDPELKQLAADLARLRAQAEAVSGDPEGLRRRAEAARARRDQCHDAACLREWYGKRRRELLAEF